MYKVHAKYKVNKLTWKGRESTSQCMLGILASCLVDLDNAIIVAVASQGAFRVNLTPEVTAQVYVNNEDWCTPEAQR